MPLPTSYVEPPSAQLDADFEDFERRASEVQKLVSALKDGTLDPKAVKIPGEKSEEEKRAEAEAAAKRKLEQERLKAKAKAKEREKWWERAELIRGFSREKAFEDDMKLLKALALGESAAGGNGESLQDTVVIKDDDGNVLFPKPKARAKDVLDYSVWDKWVPDDPVSLTEMSELQKQQREKENSAFEEANPEFCSQFKQDMAERKRSEQSKEKRSEDNVQKGNQAFKRKAYEKALSSYAAAVKVVPCNTKALRNMAQVYLKQGATDDALEFSERALFLEPDNSKNIWRRSRALELLGRLQEAVSTLELAAKLEPKNEDVCRQLALLRSDLRDDEALGRLRGDRATSLPAQRGADRRHAMHAELIDRLLQRESLCDGPVEKLHRELIAVSAVVTEMDDAIVLLRTSGLLERLCAWAMEGHGMHKTYSAVREEIISLLQKAASNKRNAVVLQQKKVLVFTFDRIKKCEADHLDFVLAATIVDNDFCEDWVIKQISNELLVGSISALQSYTEEAALLISNICRRAKTRKYMAALETVITPLVEALIATVAKYRDNLRAAESSASAVANICGEGSFHPAVVQLASVFADTFCTVLGDHSKGLATLKGLSLAVLINASAVSSEVLRAVARDPRTKQLLVMLDDYITNKRQNSTHAIRGVRLLARCFTQSDFSDLILAQERYICSIFRFASTVKDNHELFRPMLGIVASCLTARYGKDSIGLIEKSLLEVLPKAVQSKDEIFRANLLQCFIRLVNDPSRCKSSEYRKEVIPVVIEILRKGTDGPVRKNAAILLAKLAKASPKNLDVVRELRGMEMLVELGTRMDL